MTHLARVYLPLAFLFLSLAGGIAARGDDWPQFRRDARRSAWSLDAIPVPVFELWVWEGKIGAGTASIEMGVPALSRRPIGNCAVWKGRIFSVSLENSHPFLVCADVKTGYPLWRRRLNGSGAYRREVGPAVTPQGIVYVYDTVPLEEVQSRTLEDPDPDPQKPLRKSFFKVHLPASHVRLRAFRAVDGQPLGEHPLPSGFPRRQFNSLITRLWMLPGGEGRVALPGPSSHWRLADNHSLGPVLLSGESMAALSASDLLVRWHPAVRPSFLRVANGIDQIPAIQPPARFLGYPMAQSGNGMLIADDRGARFLAMVTMDSHLVWCRSVPWTLGLPAVASAMIYTGAGGPGAHSALVAIESGTGDTRWTYPPDGPAGDFTVAMKESWNLTLRSFDFEYEPVAPDEGMAVDLVNTYPLGPWSPPPIFRRVSAGRSTYFLTRPVIESTSGHEQNLGVVVAGPRVIGYVAGSLVALERQSGKLLWKRPQHMLPPLSALVGTRDHLIVCHAPTNLPREPAKLMAISLETGKTAWSAPISGVGQVATANSLLFITEPSVSGAPGGRLTAYAPAERTYHMAIDSPHPEEYRPLPVPAEAASEAGGDAPAVPAPTEAKPSPEEGVRDDAAPPPADPRALADATILRMRWGEPREELLRKALARRAAVPGRPLVLVLDWLNGPRTGRIGPHPNAGWEAAERQQFAETCAQLAAAVKPEHFEVGSDVNVYLARYPDQLEPVRALIRTARAAIQRVSPATGVLFSFNAEVLTGTYGRGGHLPFTDVPLVGPTSRGKQVTLVTEVDEVGLTTYPQAGNIQPNQMARDYFIKLRRLLGGKPVLLTRVAVHWNDSEIAGLLQTQYLKHLFRVLYWLDARVVAYPDLTGAGEGPVRSNAVLWLGGKERPALQVWRETLDWRQVPELTAKVPEPDAPVHQPD